MRVAGGDQRAHCYRDVGLLERGHEVQEHRRGRLTLELVLGGQLAQAGVGVADEAGGHEHPAPIQRQLEGGPDVEEQRDEEEERDEVHPS